MKDLIESEKSSEEIIKSLVEVAPKWSPGNMEGNWEILDNAFSHLSDPKEKDAKVDELIDKFNLEKESDSPPTWSNQRGEDSLFFQFDGGHGTIGLNLDSQHSKRDIEQILGI